MNEYKVITANNETDLEASVENFLNQGWRCQGGASLAGHYTQAMVRKKPVKS
jgi:hypothetical protein